MADSTSDPRETEELEAHSEEEESAQKRGPRFALSFIEGRALVGFEDRALTDWLSVRNFAMEVPDITFPFDVTGGADKFRHRRCRLVRLDFVAQERGLRVLLLEGVDAAAQGLEDLRVAFGEGFIEVAGTVAAGDIDVSGGDVSTPGERVPFTLKIAVDASADREVRLLVHDPRLYGPSALAGPAVAVALLRAVEAAKLPVTVEQPATIRFDPIPEFLTELLPRHGWKLPEARNLRLTGSRITKGEAVLVFDAGESMPDEDTATDALRPFLSALEGTRAFEDAEAAIAAGNLADARIQYLTLDGPLPDHPFAAERLLSLLVAEPTTRDDAFDLAEAWLERDPDFAPALWAKAVVLQSRKEAGAAAAFLHLAESAARRGERLGAISAAAAAGATAAAEDDLGLAVRAWEKALEVEPGNVPALQALARLYPKVADLGAAVRILGRLIGLAPDDPARALVHLRLGRLHAGDDQALGVPDESSADAWRARRNAEPFEKDEIRAKLHFDAALRFDPELVSAWVGLGRVCAQRGEALRAVRCLDRGREGLIEAGEEAMAASVAMEIGRLWEHDLDHLDNALLRYRQVIEHDPTHIEAHRRYAEISLVLGHVPEAEIAFRDLLDRIEGKLGTDDEDAARAGLSAHAALARITRERHEDMEASAAHLEAAFELAERLEDREQQGQLAIALVDAYDAREDASGLVMACERAAALLTDRSLSATMLAKAALVLAVDLDQADTARERIAEARALDADSLETLEVLARIEALFGTPQAHANALEALAHRRVDPEERARTLMELGRLRADVTGEQDSALAVFAQAREDAESEELALDAAQAHVEVARQLMDLEQLANSLMSYAERLEGYDGRASAEVRIEEAQIRQTELGDLEGALAAASVARQTSPSNPNVLWQLGYLHLQDENWDAAHLTFLDLVSAGGPAAAGVPPMISTRAMGEAALKADDSDAAIGFLTEALRNTPGDSELQDMVDVLLDRLGRDEERVELLHLAARARSDAGDLAGAAKSWIAAAQLLLEKLDDPAAAEMSFRAALAAALPEEAAGAAFDAMESDEPPVTASIAEPARLAAETLLRMSRDERDPVTEAQALLALAALSPGPEQAAELLVEHADRLADAGDDLGALGSLQRAVRLSPDRMELRERLADGLARTDPKEALAHYERLLLPRRLDDAETRERVANWRRRAGEIAIEVGRPDRARHHLALYLAYQPTDEGILARFLDLLRDAEEWSDLHDTLLHFGELLTARSHQEQSEDAAELAVDCFVEAGEIARVYLDAAENAREAFELALAILPDDTRALLGILPLLDVQVDALVRAELFGRLAEGSTDLADRARYFADRGTALLVADDGQRAEEAFVEALRSDSNSSVAAEGIASCAWERGDLGGFAGAAEQRARQASGQAAEDAAIRELVVARLWLDELEEVRRGRESLDCALGDAVVEQLSDPERREAHERRLACHLELQEASGAEVDLTALARIERGRSKQRANYLRQRADLREGPLEDTEGAREDWAEAHRLDPADDVAFARLIRYATDAQDHNTAAMLHGERALRRARANDPDGAVVAWHQRARLLSDLLDDDFGARRALEQAAELPSEPELTQETLVRLRSVLDSLDEVAESVRVAVRQVETMPEDEIPAHLLAAGQAAADAGETELAIRCARLGFGRAPDDLPLASALFQRLYLAGGHGEAVEPARVLASRSVEDLAKALDAGESEAVRLQRQLVEVLGDVDASLAADLIEQLVERAPTDESLVRMYVDQAKARGDLAGARAALERHQVTLPEEKRASLSRELADLSAGLGDHTAEARWLLDLDDLDVADLERVVRAQLAAADARGYADAARRLVTIRQHEDFAGAVNTLTGSVESLADQLGAPEDALVLSGHFESLRAESEPLLSQWHRIATGARDQEQAAAALAALAALALDEGDDLQAAEHFRALGDLQVELGSDEEAEFAYTQALQRGLEDVEVATTALELAEKRGEPGAVADLRETLVDLVRDDQEAAVHLVALAGLYGGPLEAPRRAEAALREALNRDPESEPAVLALASMLVEAERFADAARLYRDRAETREGPGAAQAWLLSATHAVSAAAPEDAVQDLVAAREADPETFAQADGDQRLDDARAMAGQHRDRAEARLELADSREQPESLLLEAGDLFREEVGDVVAAEAAYRRAFEVDHAQSAAEKLRTVLFERDDHRGLAELARVQAEHAPVGPARSALYRSAGDLFRDHVGDLDAAIDAYEHGLDAEPSNQALAGRLSDALGQAGRTSDLAALTVRLAEDAAGAERASKLLEAAALNLSTGDFEAALKCLLDAESADTDRVEVREQLAEVLWSADRKAEAAERYRWMLERTPGAEQPFERLTAWLESEEAWAELAGLVEDRAERREDVDLYLRAADLHTRAKAPERARVAAELAFTIAPERVDVFEAARAAAEREDDHEGLAQVLGSHLEVSEDDFATEPLLDALIGSRVAADDLEGALTALNDLLEHRGEDVDLLQRAAELADRTDVSSAPFHERLLAAADTGAEVPAESMIRAHRALGENAAQDDIPKAVEHYVAAIRLTDDEDLQRDFATRVAAITEQGRDHHAIAESQVRLAKMGDEDRAHHLAEAARSWSLAGRSDEARGIWGVVFAENPAHEEAFEALVSQAEDRAPLFEQHLAAIEDPARRAMLFVELAALHREGGNEDARIEALIAAEEADAENQDTRLELADALWRAARKDEAAERYRWLLERDPLTGLAYERLAELLEDVGGHVELAELTEGRARAAEGQLSFDLELRAVSLWRKAGRKEEALAAGRRAFETQPADPAAFEAVRESLEAAEDVASLIAAHLEAADDDDRTSVLLRDLAHAREEAGDNEGARDALDTLLERDPSNVEVLVLGARLAEGTEQATKYDRRLLALADQDMAVGQEVLLSARRRLATAADDPGERVEHLQAAMELTASSEAQVEIAEELSQAAEAAGRSDVVAFAQQRLGELATEGERIQYLIAAARARDVAGEHDAASQQWKFVFELDPSMEEAARAVMAGAEPAEQIKILRRHLETVEDIDPQRRLLEEVMNIAAEAGDTGAADTAALQAWELDRTNVESATRALDALRARVSEDGGAEDLDEALTRVSEGADDESRFGALLESANAFDTAGRADRAVSRALAALALAEGIEKWDDEMTGRIERAVGLALPRADPGDRARLHELAARAAGDESGLESWLKAADAHQRAGSGEAALAALVRAESLAPADRRPLDAMVDLHLGSADPAAAAEVLLRIADIQEGLPERLMEVASTAQVAGDGDTARRLLEVAAQREPDNPETHLRLAGMREAANDPVGAAQAADAAYHAGSRRGDEIFVQHTRALRVAKLWANAGDESQAAEAWHRVLELEPMDQSAVDGLRAHFSARKDWLALAELHGRHGEALAANEQDEAAADAAIQSADAYREAGEEAKARAAVDLALARRPGHRPAVDRLREIASLSGDPAMERAALQAQVSSTIDARERAEAALALGRLEFSEGEDVGGAAAMRVALAAVGDKPTEELESWEREIVRESAQHLAAVTNLMGDAYAALALIDRAKQAGATGTDVFRIDGTASLEANQPERAREAYNAILEIDPTDISALEGLIRAGAGMNDIEAELGARERRVEMTESAEERAELWLVLAERARHLERPEVVKRAEAKALETNPASDKAFEAMRKRAEQAGDSSALYDLWRNRARVVGDDEARARAFFENGEVARNDLHDLHKAAEAYERSLAADPEYKSAMAALAETLHQLGDHDRAEELYRRLPNGGPSLPAFIVHNRLGEYAMARQRYEDALASFREATERNAAFSHAWLGARAAAQGLGDVDGEATALEGLLEALPGDDVDDRADVLKALAELDKRRLRTNSAMLRYEEARRTRPGDPEVLQALADLYSRQGRWDQARVVLEEFALATHEPDVEAEVWMRLAKIVHDRLADPESSIPYVDRAIAADPESVAAWEMRLELAAPRGDVEMVTRAAQQLTRLGHAELAAPYQVEVGRAMQATGDPAQAVAQMQAAVAERPHDRDLVAEAAAVFVLAGHASEAATALWDLAAHTGEPADVRAAAEGSLTAGDTKRYIDLMWHGLRDPTMDQEAQVLTARGLSLLMADKLQDTEGAIAALTPYAKARPQDLALQRDMANLLVAGGRADEALEQWLGIIYADPTDRAALVRASQALEPFSPLRAGLLQGIDSYLAGSTGGAEPDLSKVQVGFLTRNDLGDPAAVAPFGWFMRAMAEVVEPLFPADLARFGVDATRPVQAEDSLLVEFAERHAMLFTERPFRIFRSERLGFEGYIENTRPASLVFGAPVFDAAPSIWAQVVIRFIDLLGAGYALPGKLPVKDVDTLVRLTLSYFNSSVEVPMEQEKRQQYHQAMRQLCSAERTKQLRPLATEAAAVLENFSAATFAQSLRTTADRISLMVTGDVAAALEVTHRLDRRATAGDDRAEVLRTQPAVLDLCRFVLRPDFETIWRSVHRP